MLSMQTTHSETISLCGNSAGGALASSKGGAEGFVSGLLITW